jgi:hypothetical protein
MQTPQTETKTETKMVADPKRTKLIRIRAKRECLLKGGITLMPGQEADVSEEEAQEFTKSHEGMYNFSGERDNSDATRAVIQRAERVEPKAAS